MELRDPVSSLSHLLAAAWAAYAAVVLLRLTLPVGGRRAAVAIFGGSMVLLYAASGVYHGVPFSNSYHPDVLWFLQTADRSAVFLLIAGTNTPIMTVLLGGRWRSWCLWVMWALAFAGVVTLWALPQPPFGLTVAVYVGMGWLGVAPLAHYVRTVGWRGMSWVVAGGLLYTAGAACDVAKWPTLVHGPLLVGPHEVFHMVTVAGSVAFYIFIRRYVVRYIPSPAE